MLMWFLFSERKNMSEPNQFRGILKSLRSALKDIEEAIPKCDRRVKVTLANAQKEVTRSIEKLVVLQNGNTTEEVDN